MVLKNTLFYITDFLTLIYNQLRKIYLNSSIYNKKISKTDQTTLDYKPSPSLLNCIIKFQKKREKIENFNVDSIWLKKNINYKDLKKLHSFYWLFSVDLKSSKKIIHSIINNWINNNKNYNSNIWEIDILSKRVISWISNSKLIYDESEIEYKKKFNEIVKKQINHLMYEINRSDLVDDKMIGCTAIILSGLSYKNSKFLSYGLNLLKKIIKQSFTDENFPKSRSIRQSLFYLKYFILIREFLKEAQSDIPDYLDEIIFYLGQAYNLFYSDDKKNFLFNGNNELDNYEFNKYLFSKSYKFKNTNHEIGGYLILRKKNICIAMDLGNTPEKKYSNTYQSGTLSFEVNYGDKKLITNSGFFQNYNHQLSKISKSSASHSTAIIDNRSICRFKRNSKGKYLVDGAVKIIDKKHEISKDHIFLMASHDGYLKDYGIIHQRKITIYPEKTKIIGTDKFLKEKNFKSSQFDIRFHLSPESKLTKTQDEKTVLIELENSGWRFSCKNYFINTETGLYFGKKNSYIENQNIFISGETTDVEQEISWELIKE
tara:strand:+ start:1290 stop:2918 length:1629 start_codon:yes stop_codon:yes gene_type:complete